ncbi:MAG TPA: ATP-binding protein [Ideonella sp.]|nr:ATP-binding protein [Ideonella sp.]
MNRVSDALALRPWRWAPALAALVLLSGLLFATSMWVAPDAGVGRSADAAAGPGALALLFTAMALVVAVLALLLGAALERSRLAPALRQARGERQALATLIDAWQWQTDAAHRLTRLVPPHGAPAPAWTAAGHAGELLWERYESEDAALAARLEARAPLRELCVVRRLPGGAAPERWRLDGEPLFDGQGRFDGYLGTARSLAAEPAPAPPAAPAAPAADDARGDLGETEAFSYTVSHDLRAPIRVVEGFTRIVKEDYGRVLDRIGLDHLDRVLGAAARMNHMIDALLTLSQLSTQPLVRQPVNLSQLAGFVVDDLRRGAPERVVEVQIEPDLIVQGDPTLLRIVLENLLGNAWKYSARVEAARIAFESGGGSGKPSFTVRDNGAGFDMRFADRLFGVFQRLHSASEFQGTGVGLASVRRIVRRHGGEIWAESEVGRGAAFHFTVGS